MTFYLLEPDLSEQEIAWIDGQIANGRFTSRTAAVLELLGRGLESEPMTAGYINDLDHWRERAAEIRTLAAEMKEEDTKAILVRLAADYDKLAARTAQRAGGIFRRG